MYLILKTGKNYKKYQCSILRGADFFKYFFKKCFKKFKRYFFKWKLIWINFHCYVILLWKHDASKCFVEPGC